MSNFSQAFSIFEHHLTFAFMHEKNNPKTLTAWAMYDWANSVYNLLITTAIFPIYYRNAVKGAFGVAGTNESGQEVILVEFFGFSIKSSALYSYAISFSFLLVVILSPILSGVADYSGRKKFFMQFFTYLGASACLLLYFFEGANVEFGIAMATTASLGFAGSLVFYNAFLPEIATEDRFDQLSARGYSLGYIGSVLLLIVVLFFVMNPDLLFSAQIEAAAAQLEAEGLDKKTAVSQAQTPYVNLITRYSFLMVGLWWIGFAQIPFARLRDLPGKGKAATQELLTKGIRELRKVANVLSGYADMRSYLLAFFLYSVGVQTVMLLAPTFAQGELNIETTGLILIVLIIQLIAIGGAYLFAQLSKYRGNRFSLLTMIGIWLFVCISAYLVQTAEQFYVLAIFVGLVMGGIQSLSRSTFSKLIPEDTLDHASFFSFYDITEKLAIVIGTASFGLIDQLTGSMRNSALVLMVFFVLGGVILARTNIRSGRRMSQLED